MIGWELQWSRGPKAAETPTVDEQLSNIDRLQWSRGPKAAETARRRRLDPDHQRASMEPRPEGRGDEAVQVAGMACRVALQWSRGPKAAETSIGTGSVVASLVLQWSRGPKAAETYQSESEGMLEGWASMEPRPEGRGDDEAWGRLEAEPWLQWSRGPKAAETRAARRGECLI